MTTVLILVGSVRAESVNLKLAHVAVQEASDRVSTQIYPALELLPHFNQDVEDNPPLPEAVTRFKNAVTAADAILVVTPTYNGAPSSLVKNAIDWGSRPYGEGPLSGKFVAVVGASFNSALGQQTIRIVQESVNIAGGVVIEETAYVSIGALPDGDPSQDPVVVEQVRTVLEALEQAAQASSE